MKRYVISYVDLFEEPTIHTAIVSSDDTELNILKDFLKSKGIICSKKEYNSLKTVQDVKEFCINTDNICNIMEIE